MTTKSYFYGKAPQIFDQNLKKVNFDVPDIDDPFGNIIDGEKEDVSGYKRNSKFASRVISFVLCEDLNAEEETVKNEFSPVEFWDYLYSDSWGEESSLRVLDGELLELIFHSLNVLLRDGSLFSRNTFAFARNTRLVKNKDDTSNTESKIHEVLVINFTYYARMVERDHFDEPDVPIFLNAMPIRLNISFGVDSSLTKYEHYDHYLEVVESFSNPKKRVPSVHIVPLFPISKPKSEKIGYFHVESVDTGLLGKKGSIKTVPLSLLKTHVRKMSKIDKFHQGRNFGPNTVMPRLLKKDEPKGCQNLCVILENIEHIHNPRRFSRSIDTDSMVSDVLEAMDEDGSKIIEQMTQLTQRQQQSVLKKWKLEEVSISRKRLRNHYYIDQHKPTMDTFKDSREKLRYKLKEIQLQREKNKKVQNIKREIKGDSENETVKTEWPSNKILKLIKEVPSFEDLLKWIKAVERHHKKLKRNMRANSEYKQVRRGTAKKGSAKSGKKTDTKFDTSENERERNRQTAIKKRSKKINISPSSSLSELSWSSSSSGYGSPAITPSTQTQRRWSSSSSVAVTPDLHEKTHAYSIVSDKVLEKTSSIKEVDEETGDIIEEETQSESKSDIQISKYIKRDFSREKFLESARNRSIALLSPWNQELSPPLPSDDQFILRKHLVHDDSKFIPAEGQPQVLGQLKHFKFLNYRNYEAKHPDVVIPDWSRIMSLDDFKWRLLKAMDDFVIRKENINTNYNYKCISSVTFTRPAAFKKFQVHSGLVHHEHDASKK